MAREPDDRPERLASQVPCPEESIYERLRVAEVDKISFVIDN